MHIDNNHVAERISIPHVLCRASYKLCRQQSAAEVRTESHRQSLLLIESESAEEVFVQKSEVCSLFKLTDKSFVARKLQGPVGDIHADITARHR